ncbi:carboxymuconolactone decarboxylase family protein [Streptomyces sp. NPDC028635]|uniref:carboxymuconolactone decarboxylase family protein n=1 Tax=Streptomyces sp. NPDC028635 TaxID=3154800 RepID=UPI0033FBBB61
MTARTTLLDSGVRDALQQAGAAAKRGLDDPVLAELVMIRASQLNQCAFCLDMHLTLARENGESDERIQLLNAWREAGERYSARERAALALTEAVTVLAGGFVPDAGERYSARERAALALTEAVTVLAGGFVPDAVYEGAAAHFEKRELAHLLGLIAVVNSWNRLMVSRRVPPGGPAW